MTNIYHPPSVYIQRRDLTPKQSNPNPMRATGAIDMLVDEISEQEGKMA
jgi:hypothetical protein